MIEKIRSLALIERMCGHHWILFLLAVARIDNINGLNVVYYAGFVYVSSNYAGFVRESSKTFSTSEVVQGKRWCVFSSALDLDTFFITMNLTK